MAMKKILLRKIEYIWHIFAFVLLQGAFIPLWRQMTQGEKYFAEGDPYNKGVLIIAYMGTILLLFHPRPALRIARRTLLLWVLVGWALLSTAWSVIPEITLLRGLSVLVAGLYGLLLAVRYKPDTVLHIMGVALAIVVIASLMAALTFPEWAVMTGMHQGAWRGVLFHKNALGRISTLALIVFWTIMQRERGKKRLGWLLLIAAAGVNIISSRSATGLILALITIAAWCVLQIWKHLPRLLRPAIGSLALAVALPATLVLPGYLEAILGFFGKDLTLTGRILLWRALIPVILKRPLLGYGYGAFWQGDAGPAYQVWAAVGWEWPHAHNGFIDLWLEMGFVGVFVGILLILILIISSKRLFLRGCQQIGSFLFLYGIYIFASNVSESVLLRSGVTSGVFYWVLFVYCYVLVQQENKSWNFLITRAHPLS